MLGIRRRLTDAAKDDFWKVRKAGFSLLMALVGDAKPIAFVEDTAVDPARLPEFYERFRAIVERQGVAAACYGHADVGCLHIRPIINVKTAEGIGQIRAIAREVSDLVVEFGGAMSGEHGDGLARSLWNAKLFGPEVYACFEAVKRAFDPAQPDESRQGRRRARPDRQPPDRPRLSPGGARDHPRLLEPGRVRPRRRDVLGRRRLPQGDRRDDVPELHGHPRRGAHDPGPGQRAAAGDVGGLARGRPGQRDPARGARPLPPVQGVQERVPLERRHGQAQGRVPPPLLPGAPDAAGVALDGSDPPPQPARRGDRPAGQLDARAAAGSSGSSRRRPASTAAASCPASTRTTSASGFESTRSIPAPGRGERWCCWTTASPPTTRPPSAARRYGCWRRRATGSSWRAWPAAAGRRSRRGCSPSAATWPARTWRDSSSTPAEASPIVGCEPSCLLTLVDEYRDFRIGPDADLVAASALLVDAFVADTGASPSLP